MSDDFLIEIQDSFLDEASENLARTEGLFLQLEKTDQDHTETLNHLRRLAHNFKGTGKAVGFDSISSFCHAMENLLIAVSGNQIPLSRVIVDLLLACNDALKEDLLTLRTNKLSQIAHPELLAKIESALQNPGQNLPAAPEPERPQPARQMATNPKKTIPPTADDSIRIPMSRLGDLFDSFGEQVLNLSALDHLNENFDDNKEEIFRTLFNLKKITFDLQQSVLSLRMVNLKSLFGKLERSIRDTARQTEKNVECLFIGMEQELDKSIVDQVADALVHMVRNAVDHGIESETTRRESGKNPQGKIELRAFRQAGRFILEIKDDGKGLDPDKIRAKALSVGLIRDNQELSKEKIYDLIFENGFSTKEQVSEVSGRGVGMNVVKEVIAGLGGEYEISSEVGKGTLFRLKLPMSLSLFNGLILSVNGSRYVVPSSQIKEIVASDRLQKQETRPGRTIVQLRQAICSVIDLRSTLKLQNPFKKEDGVKKKELLLVSEIDREVVCFTVDQVTGISRIVQKPMTSEMGYCPGAVGVSILGDGQPTFILDLRLIYEQARRTLAGVA